MANVDSRKKAGRATVTKYTFAKRLQPYLEALFSTSDVSVDAAQKVFEAVLEEIRKIVKDGDRLHINDFGMFYGKKMKKRVVRGGILPDSFDNAFVVPEKTKIGFSSTPSGDKLVSQE